MSWLTDTRRYRNIPAIIGMLAGAAAAFYITFYVLDPRETSFIVGLLVIVVPMLIGAEIGRLFHPGAHQSEDEDWD